jgi:hypothetical protein
VADEIKDDAGFDFADFGVDTKVVSSVRVPDGNSVVVQAREDVVEVIKSSEPQQITKQENTKRQVAVMIEKATDPMGKVAETKAPSESFVVVSENKATPEVKQVEKPVNVKKAVKEGRGEVDRPKVIRSDVDEQLQAETKIKYDDSVRKENVVVKKEAVVVESKNSDLDFFDAPATKEEVKEESGMRVASRSKSGITVMKIKQ